MCSSGDQTLKSTEQSNAALTAELGADYQITFSENQAIQKQLTGILQNQISNPQGLPPEEIAAARTSATDRTGVQFENATRSANAVSAAHGGAALPSGVSAQISGDISATAASADAAEQNQITVADAQAKQQNYWNAISGLGAVGQGYNPTGYSNSAAGVGSSTANLGSAFLASQQAGWQDLSGIISAAGGLATGVAGLSGKLTPSCYVAAAIYGGWFEPRTVLVRNYIYGNFSKTLHGRLIARMYSKTGRWISQQPILVKLLTPVFNLALKKAQGDK
jgi:hypothetical protein